MFETRHHHHFDPCDPELDLSMINIKDLAHHLALVNRFGGATPEPYSVAQHCVLVAHQCPKGKKLWGLLHDGTEAYLGDLPAPVKKDKALKGYRLLERQLEKKIYVRFGLIEMDDRYLGLPPWLNLIDRRMCITEAVSFGFTRTRYWKPKAKPYEFRIKPWSWQEARTKFIALFEERHEH